MTLVRRILGVMAAGLLSAGLMGAELSNAQMPPPVEAFGRLPMIQSVKMSPDGTHYAAIQAHNNQKILAIYDIYGQPGKTGVH